jgi:hypothetical protein
MDTHPDSELETFGLLEPLIQVSHRRDESQPRVYCSVRSIFMSVGIAKIDQEPIA